MKVHLELFTANICSSCADAKNLLSRAIEDIADDRLTLDYLDVVENLDHAVKSGVLATPALVLNGKLVFCPLPKRGKILQFLKTELNK